MIVALSLHILRSAMTRSGSARLDAIEVRLALRCLLPHCPERWPLALFCDSAGQDSDIARAQGVTTAFNGIVRQPRAAGRYEERLPGGSDPS